VQQKKTTLINICNSELRMGKRLLVLTHENSAESPTPTPIQKSGDPLESRNTMIKKI
jgi:hypothetical protein